MVGNLSWFFGSKCNIKSFKIIDKRYKPADTSYLNELTQPQSLTHSEEGLTHSEWHERGELPPVGVEFESYFAMDTEPKWNKCKVAYSSNEHTILIFDDGEENYYETDKLRKIAKFRPIRTEREKVIEAVDSLIHNYQAGAEIRTEFLNVLYNAGMLVLPPKKSDTKD